MANVCVGCGLDVVGGRLIVKGAGMAGQDDLGIVCGDDGVDYVVPLIARRPPSGDVTRIATSDGSLHRATLLPTHMESSHNTGGGAFTILGDGTVRCESSGIVQVSLTGCGNRDPSSEHRILGGRVEIKRGDLIVAANSVNVVEPDETIDFATTESGPEWNCSATTAVAEDDILSWIVEIWTSVNGMQITFHRTNNVFNVARIGSLRT